MNKKLVKFFDKLGYTIAKKSGAESHNCPDIKEEEFWQVYNLCKPYTMTSPERMYALYKAVAYVLDRNIKGDFVECGVWRGGSSLVIAKMLSNRKILDRKLYLYDTFEGMSEPTANDVDVEGKNAAYLLEVSVDNKEESVWCLADLADVQNNMKLSGLPEENIIYVKGKVEDTIPGTMPGGEVALLRLDTDWYESTKHELQWLYPKLENNGVLIIDDYGHWEGCKKAVDEYFSANRISVLLNRVDYTGRIAVKTLP